MTEQPHALALLEWVNIPRVRSPSVARDTPVTLRIQRHARAGVTSHGSTAWITLRGTAHELLDGRRIMVQTSKDGGMLRILVHPDGEHRVSPIGRHKGVGRVCVRAPDAWPDRLDVCEIEIVARDGGGIVARLPWHKAESAPAPAAARRRADATPAAETAPAPTPVPASAAKGKPMSAAAQLAEYAQQGSKR